MHVGSIDLLPLAEKEIISVKNLSILTSVNSSLSVSHIVFRHIVSDFFFVLLLDIAPSKGLILIATI